MPYLFNNDKSKIELADAIIKSIFTVNSVSVQGNDVYEITENLTNASLYQQGYRPIGIGGYKFPTVADVLVVTGVWINDDQVKMRVWNPVTRTQTVNIDFYVLWAKTT